MNARMQRIIQLLLTSNELQTSTELATTLQVSSKTVQTDIKNLKGLLNNEIATIESYRGKGYFFNVKDENEFKRFLSKVTERNMQVIPTEPEERQQFLIEKLLLQPSYLKMDDLAEELFVSRSTLQSDINHVRKIVESYDLFLEQKPNYGIKVSGNEMDVRFCISEYIFNQKADIMDPSSDLVEILAKDEIDWIRDSILSKLREHKIIITDVSLNNLITHIAISCKRIHERENIEIYHEELKQITSKKEYQIAKEIAERIEQKLNVSFSVNEIAYLAIHLQGTKKMHSSSEMEEIQTVLEDNIQYLTKNILKQVDNIYSLDLLQDKELILALSLHLKPAINRHKYQMNLRNPLLNQIKNKYPFSYEIALTIGAQVIKETLGITIDENEIGYIALHFEAALERKGKSAKNKKRCLIVCASGLGTAQLLLLKLKNQFPNELNILGTTEYYELKKQPLYDIDFIISTIPIPEKLPVPVIQISTLLGNQDVSKIEKLVHHDFEIIENYMRKSFTYLKRDFSSKEEVIYFLGDRLMEDGIVNSNFIHSVLERENYSPTSFGNLVAIPHPMDPQVNDTFWSIVTLKQPIQWDDKPVQFICLLNVSKQNQMEESKPMYDVLMKLLDNRRIIHRLLQCETYEELKKVLRSL
ncbi:PTS fructose transporter subunit IIA [Tetragenococcus osmophilus]|uniref:LicABCH operon regulator n=2 Tax=Tetragenococcus TaxID=51668 RepID=A0AA38CYE8_9ENTE|nr:BglG family transcription antiterminator [Tetragenococcus osmophilus]AYW47967.1 PTS fructose transporter subunit IIA [Tetragenococcus osmophilus]GMA53685.1 putative licABCH operon regulator [Alicyclobacillus contaminans]GMA72384.1 putative licABCH operon regulator [Tetragenococcus osmophilus]